jgi:hypothetical protein
MGVQTISWLLILSSMNSNIGENQRNLFRPGFFIENWSITIQKKINLERTKTEKIKRLTEKIGRFTIFCSKFEFK